jgi:hypothetical protein
VFQFYHEIESHRTTRPRPSQLFPDANVFSRGITLYIHAEHWAMARVSFGYAEELQVPRGEGTRGSPLTTVRVRVIANERSPGTSWDVRDDIESCRIIEIAMALLRNEVHGNTRERYIYNLVWASLRDNPNTHEWLRKHFPNWADMVLGKGLRVWPATTLKNLSWSDKFPDREGWWWFTTQGCLEQDGDLIPIIHYLDSEDVGAGAFDLDDGVRIDADKWEEERWRTCPLTYMGMSKKRRQP